LKTVLHWFRRDLRVIDNTALFQAAQSAERVIPVFVLEDSFRTGRDVGGIRVSFLLRSLESLAKNLETLGYKLIVRSGRSEDVIPQLAKEAGAQAVFTNNRYEPYAQARDRCVRENLRGIGVELRVFKDAVVWEEKEILTKSDQPYTVFTPYSKTWKLKPVPPPWPKLAPAKSPAPNLATEPLFTDPARLGHPTSQELWPAGEKAARESLDQFLQAAAYRYAEGRNFPAHQSTSRLSPHLRAGTIGIRTVLQRVNALRADADAAQLKSLDTYVSELVWREFYLQILHNFPHVMRGAFRPEYDALEWSGTDDQFQAWCAGQTGYPIVDAAMRCLNATGWMHNRLRMIVAMFLTKDLLVNWQRGERYFMEQLVDGDMAANNGGWQWSAGTGTDAAPYFRIFNPVSQAEKFDPDGAFVRHWLPELSGLPADLIHQPWENPLLLSRSKYVERIVRHDVQRERCLAMFKKLKG
jgi:deoxyribodipyrimidine photo-lyase